MQIPKVAIVGGESLLSRDLTELFGERAPDIETHLLGSEIEGAILTERGGEPAVIQNLDEDLLRSCQAVLLAGSRQSSLMAYERIVSFPERPGMVDLTHTLEDQPDARLAAPLVGPTGSDAADASLHVIAHPAASVLALFFRQLHQRHPIRRAVVQVLEPASERGRAGVDELHQQTVQLLSFKPLPKDVFGEQLSFNLLSRYGDEAAENLGEVEARVERHLATLLAAAGDVPMPSLRVIQAPVFHGHCFSLWVEFRKNPGPEELLKAVASERIEVRTREDEPPANASVASLSGMVVDRIERDTNDANAAWFWIVADNHRTTTENALLLTRWLVGGESKA